ncbi:MAG: hypothetical protein ACI8XM_000999 [Haloarculaceae archaeon]|jgi:uncharacterized protein (TIGR00106 family)
MNSSVDQYRAGEHLRTAMTVVALLSVAPVRKGSMAEDVADAVAALDEFDVTYETNPMGTVIEAEDIDTLLDAVGAAHKAVEGERVSTVLKVDDKRTVETSAAEKVESVEDHLGRPARSDRE